MTREYVALLRAISNVSMRPFREALEELGFEDVQSYGMSGNLMFNVGDSSADSPPELEGQISERLGVTALVRTRDELRRVVAGDPFRREAGGAVLFLARPASAARRRELAALELDGQPPLVRGKTVFFVHPTRLRGRRSAVDLERFLGVVGTARSSRVVAATFAMMM